MAKTRVLRAASRASRIPEKSIVVAGRASDLWPKKSTIVTGSASNRDSLLNSNKVSLLTREQASRPRTGINNVEYKRKKSKSDWNPYVYNCHRRQWCSVTIAQWENECISRSVLPVAWVQFAAAAEYFKGFFPGWSHSANQSWASEVENGPISPQWHAPQNLWKLRRKAEVQLWTDNGWGKKKAMIVMLCSIVFNYHLKPVIGSLVFTLAI